MEGDIRDEERMGVIPRAAKEIFTRLSGEQFADTRVTVSYLEASCPLFAETLHPTVPPFFA